MKEENNAFNPASLRLKAERLLNIESSNSGSVLSETETLEFIHELLINRTELELHNEELIKTIARDDIVARNYVELYDFSPSGCFTLSRKGEILALNLYGSQLISKDRALLVNNKFEFLLTDDTKPVFNHFLKTIFSSKINESCEVILLVDGNPPMDVILRGKVSENGNYCLMTLNDITEHKKTDKALTESRELYEDLVSYQSAGIYRILVEQKIGKSIIESSSIEFASDRFCELLEVDKSKFLKNAINETFSKIHPDDLPEFIKSNEIAQQSLESYVWEGRLLIDNRIKWLRFESSPRKLENGSIRWTGIAIDISKHKQDEEVILNKLRELEIYYELAIKREHKMIALKSEINLLLERLGEKRKY